jgi:hypothetical protein
MGGCGADGIGATNEEFTRNSGTGRTRVRNCWEGVTTCVVGGLIWPLGTPTDGLPGRLDHPGVSRTARWSSRLLSHFYDARSVEAWAGLGSERLSTVIRRRGRTRCRSRVRFSHRIYEVMRTLGTRPSCQFNSVAGNELEENTLFRLPGYHRLWPTVPGHSPIAYFDHSPTEVYLDPARPHNPCRPTHTRSSGRDRDARTLPDTGHGGQDDETDGRLARFFAGPVDRHGESSTGRRAVVRLANDLSSYTPSR